MKKIILNTVIISAVLALVWFVDSGTRKDIQVNSKIKAGKDVTLYVASDIHYLAKSLTDGGDAFKQLVETGDGKQLDYIDEIMSTFSYEIKNKKPDVLIISGDLTKDGEKESHLELAKRLKDIESSGTSVYVIPGNHDIMNSRAVSYEGEDAYVAEHIKSEDFSKIYADFGYDEAVLRDKDTLSYLAAPSEDVWLLMLDTCRYKVNTETSFPAGDGEISDNTFKWIKKCTDLAKSKGARIVTVMHHNLIDHSAAISEGYTLNNSKKAVEEFNKDGLKLVFSGHIHMQDISSCKSGENTIYDVASSALAVYPNQYGVMKYTSNTSEIDYNTTRLDVESWAKATGAQRKSLYNFKSNAEEFFGQRSYDRTYKRLMMEEIYTKEQIDSMANMMRLLNLRGFAGTENLNEKDVINSEAYKLWMNYPGGFNKNYLMSLLKDKDDNDDNKLNIKLEKLK